MRRSVQVRNKKYDLARREIHKAVSNGIKKVALAIEGHAAVNAPIDTGNLRASIYSETVDESGVARAHESVRGHGIEPAVVDVEINEELRAKVAVAAHYGVYVELGTVNSGAQPYLGPAVESVRPLVDGIIEREIKKAVAKP